MSHETPTPTPTLAGAELPTEPGWYRFCIKALPNELLSGYWSGRHLYVGCSAPLAGMSVPVAECCDFVRLVPATPPAPPESRPLTISDDLPDLLFRRCGLSQGDTLKLAEEIRAMAKATTEAAEAKSAVDKSHWLYRKHVAELRAADSRIKALEAQLAEVTSLVRHCWVHSKFDNCGYTHMANHQKILFDSIIGLGGSI